MWNHCLDCGSIFCDEDTGHRKEILTRIDGQPYIELRVCCPSCGGEFEDAKICRKCGRPFSPGKVIANLYCHECLEEFMIADKMKRYIQKFHLDDFAEWIHEGGA